MLFCRNMGFVVGRSPVKPGMTVMVGIAYVGQELSDFDIIKKRFVVYLKCTIFVHYNVHIFTSLWLLSVLRNYATI